jgi:hypothetical protein
MFNTLLDSVRLHCHSSPYHFQLLVHNWTPEPGQESVLQLMTSYLNIMEKAMGSPFVLRNAAEQLKQLFQKVPQTKPQAFSLAAGLPGKVESKIDFSGFQAAVSTYMQEFLAHTPPNPHACRGFPLLGPTTIREKKSEACLQNTKLTASIESSLVCSATF